MDIRKRKISLFQIISYLLLIACLLGTINYVRLKKNNIISSDESSEMILGSLLASENSIISKNWHYSTELRVLNANIFYSFFFHFTDSWHLVRVCALFSMYMLLLVVYWGLSRVCKFNKFFAVTAVVFFLPFSSDYYHFVLMGGYYFAVIITSLFTLAIAELFLHLSGWKKNALAAFSFIFALLTCLGGMRQLFFTYIPLFAASCIMLLPRFRRSNGNKWFVFAAITLLGGVIGVMINLKVLAEIYSFQNWGTVSYSEFSIDRITDILNGIVNSFGRTLGYTTGRLFSDSLLNNTVCACWILLTAASVWYAIKNHRNISAEYARLTVFTCASYVFYIVFYSFTTMLHFTRYNITIICLSFPLAAMFLDQVKWKKIISTGMLAGLVLLTVVRGANYYVKNWNYDPNVENRRIAKFLVTEGYYNGYATFWFANDLTEFSNGKLDVWHWIDGTHDIGITLVTDIDHTWEWLQKVIHDTTHPVGKTFLLFTVGEDENNNWHEQLQTAEKIYSSDHYVIYGFEDYDHLIATLYPGYDFVFGENQWVENGEDIGDRRVLYAGGVSHGPYQTLWPGKYQIVIEGHDLSETSVRCAYGEESRSIYIAPLEETDDLLKYEFELTEKVFDNELWIKNVSEDPGSKVEIDSISIKRIAKQ